MENYNLGVGGVGMDLVGFDLRTHHSPRLLFPFCTMSRSCWACSLCDSLSLTGHGVLAANKALLGHVPILGPLEASYWSLDSPISGLDPGVAQLQTFLGYGKPLPFEATNTW